MNKLKLYKGMRVQLPSGALGTVVSFTKYKRSDNYSVLVHRDDSYAHNIHCNRLKPAPDQSNALIDWLTSTS